ncbi:MAG: hypothetical protein FWF61_02875 [Brevinematales bacterium]|nr:hypothetical protein [Brevinematales bacterium]
MIEKKYRAALLIELAQRFTVIFSLALIAITIAGMLIRLNGQDMRDVSTLFAFNSGLQYSTIMQTAGFSLIIAFFSVLLFSEHIQMKIRFLFRGFLLLLATLVTTSVFAIIFNWFPQDNIQGWFGFVFCTIVCFVVCFALTFLKLKLEGKKYAKLLTDYKVRHNNSA